MMWECIRGHVVDALSSVAECWARFVVVRSSLEWGELTISGG